MDNFYKGYIPTRNKRAYTSFKDGAKLYDLDFIGDNYEYAGVLADDTVLIDIDDLETSDRLLKLVTDLGLPCRVYGTTRGKHFLFKCKESMTNRTHCTLAIGIEADIKGGGKASYEVLKFGGVEREVLYDAGEYGFLPYFLKPMDKRYKGVSTKRGSRNSELYAYILTLSAIGFEKEEIKTTIRLINDYIMDEPLPNSEIESILRDESFKFMEDGMHNKTKSTDSRGRTQFDVGVFTKELVEHNQLVKYNGQIYFFNGKIYSCEPDELNTLIYNSLPTSKWNTSTVNNVKGAMACIVPKVTTKTDCDWIAFDNCLVNCRTGEIQNHSPNYFITNVIPHDYNPYATSDVVDKTFKKLACGDDSIVRLLYQSVGYSLYRDNFLRKSFFLLGDKRNGKSTFLRMLECLFGDENTSALDLKDLSSQFRCAEINNKLTNIGDDISSEALSNSDIFKKIVSGETITVEHKGKNPFKMKPYAKCFFSANALPKVGVGDSQAVLDRLIIIPFNAIFDKSDPDYDPHIKSKLTSEDAIEYLIIKAMAELKELLLCEEFMEVDAVTDQLAEYSETLDPLYDYYAKYDIDDFVNKEVSECYHDYKVFCVTNGMDNMTALDWRATVKKHYKLATKRVKLDGVDSLRFEVKDDRKK